MAIELTAEERRHLETLEGKYRHIRSAVRGVVKEFHTGLFLWGEGGTGKSYAVEQELDRLHAKRVHHKGRLTGRGLVDALARAPGDIHFIEDTETLLDDKRAWGVLRSALWSQSRKKPPEREITWTAYGTDIRIVFTGGIIIVSNNLSQTVPELRAIKSRINVLGLDVSNDEIKALMKKISRDGFVYGEDAMTPEECWEVAGRIIGRLAELRSGLDPRLLVKGFKTYLQWRTGHSDGIHWHEMLEGQMKERVPYAGRAAQKAEESRVALEIHGMKLSTKEKLTLWKERTGLGQAAYYRALDRLKGRKAPV